MGVFLEKKTMLYVSADFGFWLSFLSSIRSSTLGGPSMQIFLAALLQTRILARLGKTRQTSAAGSSGNFASAAKASPAAAEGAL